MTAEATKSIQKHRNRRIQKLLSENDCAGIVIFDPVNLRYATGSRNMQVWTMHNFCRYAFIAPSDEIILFDLPSSKHLSENLEHITQIRPSLASDYLMVGGRGNELASRCAEELCELMRAYAGENKRLYIDRSDLLLTQTLEKIGIELLDGKQIMERARATKSIKEINALTSSLRTCEDAVTEMRKQVQPGMRETDALAALLKASIERGGEYPETRLLSSGPRTNPWFQETSDRIMQAGDMLSFDTDLIGPGGFYNDISRSWIVGDKKPTDEQRMLYALAYEQMQHNLALLKPGMGFLEYSDKAFQLPNEYIPNRYADVAHGCGLGVEYPLIWYREDEEWGAYDGVFEENMVVCVECYVGKVGGREGVKLEQPVWIKESGHEVLGEYPFEEHLV